MRRYSRRYIWIGILFIAIQLIAIIRNLSSNYFSFFWYCDFVPILFALAFFMKQDSAAKGLINIGLFPQWIFLFDFLYKLFFNVSPFNIPYDVFNFSIFMIISTVIVHLSTTFALFFTYKVKPSKKDLLYSFGFLIVIYIVTLTFTSPMGEVNYVYNIGNLAKYFVIHIPFYTELWLVLAFLVTVIPTYAFQYLLFRISKRKENIKKRIRKQR